MLGNVAKRTYNGYAKSETITSNINEMEKALEVIKNDILSKKKFREK